MPCGNSTLASKMGLPSRLTSIHYRKAWRNIAWSMARNRTVFVARINDLGWPITRQDVDHVRETPRFVACEEPIPRSSNLQLSKNYESSLARYIYRASWDFTPGCSVGLADVVFELEWIGREDVQYSRFRPMSAIVDPGANCSSNPGSTSCSYTFADRTIWQEGSYIS